MAFPKVSCMAVVLVMSNILCDADAQQCNGEQYIHGMMLQRHIFKRIKGDSLGHVCYHECNADVRCQSFNYVISERVCELNSRTKEARPEDFVPNSDRFFFLRERKSRGVWPFIQIYEHNQTNTIRTGNCNGAELTAESCREIKASKGGDAVSGKYPFYSIEPKKIVLAPCDFKTEDIDECNSSIPVCDVNATCNNTVGSYQCVCKLTFDGNGTKCKRYRGLGDSDILNKRDHKKYTEKLLSYLDPVLQSPELSRFMRCWHAKTDGFLASTFHSNCDGKGPTVTIIKVNDYIFGGYSDVTWYSRSYGLKSPPITSCMWTYNSVEHGMLGRDGLAQVIPEAESYF